MAKRSTGASRSPWRSRVLAVASVVLLGCGSWLIMLRPFGESSLERARQQLQLGTLVTSGIVLVVVCYAVWLLGGPRGRQQPIATSFILLSMVSAGQAVFATIYHALSQTNPDSFSAPLNRFDAAFFAISAATTSGVTPTFAKSTEAKTLVLIHVVISLFVVVAALGIAFERIISAQASGSEAAGTRATVHPSSLTQKDSFPPTAPGALLLVVVAVLFRWRSSREDIRKRRST